MAVFPSFNVRLRSASFASFIFGSGSKHGGHDQEAYMLLNSETSGSQEEELDNENEGGSTQPWTPIRRSLPKKTLRILALLILGIAVFALLAVRKLNEQANTSLVEDSAPGSQAVAAMRDIDALYARQSTTLVEASSRYSLKTNRLPPENYDKWFKFAKSQSCLIDEYDQIHRDFEPFYQLVKEDPGFFKRRVDLAIDKAKSLKDGNELKSGEFYRGWFTFTKNFNFMDNYATLYNSDWKRIMRRIAHILPDMRIILNGRDEPRVLFNIRDPPSIETLYHALNTTDNTPFAHEPSPTSVVFKDEKKCVVPNKPTGFTGDANNASAFLINSSSADFTTDFYPILSVTKIIPCFSDILVPSPFYYSDSGWSPKYKYPNNVPWENKQAKLYWRGASSGGRISDQDDYHDFPRFRLVDIARNHTDLMDVGITVFQDWLCEKGCDADNIRKEYGITGQGTPREEVYQYKYLADVDGNSFSGRYLGLLRSGSLVFKATVFSEYFNDWLQPYKHYIPILPDLSDLVEKIEWAVENDAEARTIQEAGRRFAERVLTDAQNDCYFGLVLLEWARLVRYAENSINEG